MSDLDRLRSDLLAFSIEVGAPLASWQSEALAAQAMSRTNLELVQAAFDAYFRGDEPALLQMLATDVVITQFPEQVDVRDYHGHEGFRQVMTDWTGSWDDWSIEILGARESGDVVLATARQRGRGMASGAPIDAETTFLFTVRGGLIARWQMFSSEAQALEAMGLEGQAMSQENVEIEALRAAGL